MIEDRIIESFHKGKLFQIIYGEEEEIYFMGQPAWLQVIPLFEIDHEIGTFKVVYSLQGFAKKGSGAEGNYHTEGEVLDIMRFHADLDEWQEGDYVINYVHKLNNIAG